MDDLIAFLHARLNKREARARNVLWSSDIAESGMWSVRRGTQSYERPFIVVDGIGDGVVASEPENADPEALAEYIADNDPAWVLADVAAKRAIIDEHAPEAAGLRTVCAVCADPPVYEATWRNWPCRTVRLLALPYADHPDYREEWRPQAE